MPLKIISSSCSSSPACSCWASSWRCRKNHSPAATVTIESVYAKRLPSLRPRCPPWYKSKRPLRCRTRHVAVAPHKASSNSYIPELLHQERQTQQRRGQPNGVPQGVEVKKKALLETLHGPPIFHTLVRPAARNYVVSFLRLRRLMTTRPATCRSRSRCRQAFICAA